MSKQCAKTIDKEYNPPRVYVISQRRCRNRVTPPERYCWQHRPKHRALPARSEIGYDSRDAAC